MKYCIQGASERQSARQSEQRCENTGYEIRTREECETEYITECETVQVWGKWEYKMICWLFAKGDKIPNRDWATVPHKSGSEVQTNPDPCAFPGMCPQVHLACSLTCHKYQPENLVKQNQRIEYNFRYETRCETEYHTVKEPAYREECHEEVCCSVVY